jgi:RNA polymerase sigma-70 factor (ECF subfamily)
MPTKSESHKTPKGFPAAVVAAGRTRNSRSPNGKAAPAAERAAERKLLLAARSGDRKALGELLLHASAPAWRWSMGFCRDTDDAADLVQDVLHTLLRSLASFRGDASLSTWTYVVARRACTRRRRREQRQRPLDAPAYAHLRDRADGAPGPARRLERSELAARLEQAIGALPDAQREVLVLRDVEGLSANEVGAALGLGVRAVKSRLHRARLALRERLAPYVAGGDAPAPSGGCPETARMLSRWFEGELSAGTCARMERHVSGCPACEGTCTSLREVLGACREYGGRAVPRELQRAVRDAVRKAAAGGA